jgi:hypothetical protein
MNKKLIIGLSALAGIFLILGAIGLVFFIKGRQDRHQDRKGFLDSRKEVRKERRGLIRKEANEKRMNLRERQGRPMPLKPE